MKKRPERQPRANADPATALLRAQNVVVDLAKEIDRILDKADAAAAEIESLRQRLPEAETDAAPHRRRPSADEKRLQRAEAAAGAVSLRITPCADGDSEASINGRAPFRLSPKLGGFLRIIAAPERQAEDGLVGWRTNAEVAVMLQKHTGRAAFPNEVPKIMRRLRQAFEKAGENAFLIQTNRARGVRFALRTQSWSDADAIGGDAS